MGTDKPPCHKIGAVYVIGGRTPANMCCRAFHTVFPMVTAMRFSESGKWEDENGAVLVKCPDDHILFRLTRIRESESTGLRGVGESDRDQTE